MYFSHFCCIILMQSQSKRAGISDMLSPSLKRRWDMFHPHSSTPMSYYSPDPFQLNTFFILTTSLILQHIPNPLPYPSLNLSSLCKNTFSEEHSRHLFPRIWSSLPSHIRNSILLDSFKCFTNNLSRYFHDL